MEREMSAAPLEDELKPFAEVQTEREEELLEKANVVGVGIANKWSDGRDTGDPAVAVLVNAKTDEALLAPEDRIPKTLNRKKTDVYAVGELFAGGIDPASAQGPNAMLDAPVEDVTTHSLTGKSRPAMGGHSIGHYRITAGTAATGVVDSNGYPGIPSKYYILSNNHVLANSNDAKIGDPILQPGPADGGKNPADLIGRLSRYVPIKFDGSCNYVDAAIAETRFEWFTREVYYIGYTAQLEKQPWVNMTVKKTGRTTDFTTGRVTVINATTNVNYGAGRVAKFCKQILTTNMSAGGDSGSLVFDPNNYPVGLLFAGSANVTVINPIMTVQNALGVRLWP